MMTFNLPEVTKKALRLPEALGAGTGNRDIGVKPDQNSMILPTSNVHRNEDVD
jgi:hypothetical protein